MPTAPGSVVPPFTPAEPDAPGARVEDYAPGVPAEPGLVTAAALFPTAATGTVTLASPTEGHWLNIGGQRTYTCDPAGAAEDMFFGDAGELAALINGEAEGITADPLVRATVAGQVVTLTARAPGAFGNDIFLSRAGAAGATILLSGAHLTGGAGVPDVPGQMMPDYMPPPPPPPDPFVPPEPSEPLPAPGIVFGETRPSFLLAGTIDEAFHGTLLEGYANGQRFYTLTGEPLSGFFPPPEVIEVGAFQVEGGWGLIAKDPELDSPFTAGWWRSLTGAVTPDLETEWIALDPDTEEPLDEEEQTQPVFTRLPVIIAPGARVPSFTPAAPPAPGSAVPAKPTPGTPTAPGSATPPHAPGTPDAPGSAVPPYTPGTPVAPGLVIPNKP